MILTILTTTFLSINLSHCFIAVACPPSPLSWELHHRRKDYSNSNNLGTTWTIEKHQDSSSENSSAKSVFVSKKKRSKLLELIVSMLRGGHFDIVNHYQGSARKPPPPPPIRNEFASFQDSSVQERGQTDVSLIQSNNNFCAESFVPVSLYPPGTWERYLRATRNNVDEARRRLSATLQWRCEQGMDQILSTPHPHFDIIKRYYPHAFHLHGYNNEPVYYESPAKINLQALKENGLSLEHVLRHYALITEFMWTFVSDHQSGPMSRGITVIDLDGLRMRDFVGDVVTFVKQAATFTSQHYPERAGTIYILNSPHFFQIIWRMIKPILDPVTLEKIKVVQSRHHDPYAARNALLERIPEENIPREYGGLSQIPLGGAPQEQLLRELIYHNNYHRNDNDYFRKYQYDFGCRFCSHHDWRKDVHMTA